MRKYTKGDYKVESTDTTYLVFAKDEQDALNQGWEIWKACRPKATIDDFLNRFKAIDLFKQQSMPTLL